MSTLQQPFIVKQPEPTHPAGEVLSLDEFLKLLKAEEDYWDLVDGKNKKDPHNLKLSITRLRKIFYDKWGWDTELIRGASNVESRYDVKLVSQQPYSGSKEIARYKKDYTYQPVYRLVTYKSNDRVLGPGHEKESPRIYLHDHQEVKLPDDTYCDIAHILAGLDAFNHRAVVGPLPWCLNDLKILPHVDFNGDIVTWLGDIASSSADFFFSYMHDGKLPPIQALQDIIDEDASGSDMLGNVDAFVIATWYDIASQNSVMRLSEILEHYYVGDEKNPPLRTQRATHFCHVTELGQLNDLWFANEEKWLAFYKKQLRDNVCFQIFSLSEGKLKPLWYVVKIWFGYYEEYLKLEELLVIWLEVLKKEMKKEEQLLNTIT